NIVTNIVFDQMLIYYLNTLKHTFVLLILCGSHLVINLFISYILVRKIKMIIIMVLWRPFKMLQCMLNWTEQRNDCIKKIGYYIFCNNRFFLFKLSRRLFFYQLFYFIVIHIV